MSDVKKQHFVPRMYLKLFSNSSKGDRCYEYNSYTNCIRNVRIEEICEENYIYEIRNEKGEFLIPEMKNKIEIALSKIEKQDASMLRNIIAKVEDSNDYIILRNEEREELLGFILLMILRNKATRNALPETYNLITNKTISKKEEISFLWNIILLNIDKAGRDIENSEIIFLKNKSGNSFITASVPMRFSGYPIQNDFYMPLSPSIAIELRIPKNALINVNRCEIRKVWSEQVLQYNCKILSRDGSLICTDEKTLKRCVEYMDESDRGIINSYTKINIELIKNMPPEHFIFVVKYFVEEELVNKNKVFCKKIDELKKKGLSYDEAKNTIARAIMEEFKRGILFDLKVDWKRIYLIISKI